MPRPRILCTQNVDAFPEAVAPLREISEVVAEDADQRRLAEIIGGYDAYIAGLRVRLGEDALAHAGRLRVVATCSTGTDHIDVKRCEEMDVPILSLKDDIGFLSEVTCTAELAFGLLLAVARNIPWAFDAAKQGFWGRDVFRGHQINGKTFGVLGVGRLGTMSAQYARAFRMRVLGCDLKEIALPWVEQVDFDTLLRESDFLTVHVHLTDETRGLIGREEFAKMKDGAVLVNTSRGAVIDEAAFLDALESGKLAGAGCDVIHGEWDRDLYRHPLIAYARAHQNLVVVPHIGGVTHESQSAALTHTCQKLAKWLRENWRG